MQQQVPEFTDELVEQRYAGPSTLKHGGRSFDVACSVIGPVVEVSNQHGIMVQPEAASVETVGRAIDVVLAHTTDGELDLENCREQLSELFGDKVVVAPY